MLAKECAFPLAICLWTAAGKEFRGAAGSRGSKALLEPWSAGDSGYTKGTKKTIHSVCKSHRYFTFIAGDLVECVHISFSGPGLNCCYYMSSGSQKESHPMYSVDVCLASTFCLEEINPVF